MISEIKISKEIPSSRVVYKIELETGGEALFTEMQFKTLMYLFENDLIIHNIATP